MTTASEHDDQSANPAPERATVSPPPPQTLQKATRPASASRETRALAAVGSEAASTQSQPPIGAVGRAEADAEVTTVREAMRATTPTTHTAPAPEAASAPSADPDATIIGQPLRPPTASRPRRSTLASITQPRPGAYGAGALPPEDAPTPTPELPAVVAPRREPAQPRKRTPLPSGPILSEVPDELDEWSVADQPTVMISPRSPQRQLPAYLETSGLTQWPPKPQAAPDVAPRHPPAAAVPPPDVAQRQPGEHPGAPAGPRFASPAGRLMPPTPPAGVPRAALPNPRMERFQELRRQRVDHSTERHMPQEGPQVADAVRQWWSDLRPGLARALNYQHEARASGTHPIPAYEPTATGRLGDAFGRLAASARELTERAQSAAGPTLKRLHDQAEQMAQALVEKVEGSQARQQEPLLGPGRLAIFFRQGVTVGQAQRLLAASQARPMRIIPRKHGFLALVRPGAESEVGERLRQHPYVRDVAYLTYDDQGA